MRRHGRKGHKCILHCYIAYTDDKIIHDTRTPGHARGIRARLVGGRAVGTIYEVREGPRLLQHTLSEWKLRGDMDSESLKSAERGRGGGGL